MPTMTSAQMEMARTMREEVLEGSIRALARAMGGLYYHTYSSRRSPEGWPDVAIWTPRQADLLIVAELKRERGKLTPAQETWAAALGQVQRCQYYLWRPSDWLMGDIEEAIYGTR